MLNEKMAYIDQALSLIFPHRPPCPSQSRHTDFCDYRVQGVDVARGHLRFSKQVYVYQGILQVYKKGKLYCVY